MKKSLIALAALAATGAFAQSSVTIYGVVDLGITHASGSAASITKMTSGNVNSSRLGFKGVEDLGNGLKTTFVLEGDVAPNSGTGTTNPYAAAAASTNNTTTTGSGGFTFNRQATVGLSGSFGEVRLGRDYTPTFAVDAIYDPFGVNGSGTNAIFVNGLAASVNHLRASNSVSYFLPGNLGGFSGQVMVATNNVATTGAAVQDDGKYTGGNIGYANGPLSVHLATAKFTLSTVGDVSTNSFGAAYDLGVAKLSYEYSTDKKGALAFNNKVTGNLFGVSAPLGNGVLRASYVTRKVTQDGRGEDSLGQASIGYLYNLSPRTGLYATYSDVSNKGLSAVAPNLNSVTAAGKSASAYDVGIRHSF